VAVVVGNVVVDPVDYLESNRHTCSDKCNRILVNCVSMAVWPPIYICPVHLQKRVSAGRRIYIYPIHIISRICRVIHSIRSKITRIVIPKPFACNNMIFRS
jgi:hypothetical protein